MGGGQAPARLEHGAGGFRVAGIVTNALATVECQFLR
jgi:hypothetical protein